MSESVYFSVVIPLYNKVTLIGQTLDSVLAQTYKHFEVIVIDDGSTDGSGAIVEQMAEEDSRIRLVRQANAHVSAARNRGIRESTGAYVAFLDADDLWKENHLEELSTLAVEFPESGMLGTSYIRKLEGRPDFSGRIKTLIDQRGIVTDYFKIARDYQFIYTSSIAIRRDVFDAVGCFDEEDKLFSEDLALWMRVAARYSVAYSGFNTVFYRCDVPGQATSSGRIQRGLSPKLPKTCGEVLANSSTLVANRKSLQAYCDAIIFRRLIRYIIDKTPSIDGFHQYSKEGEVPLWARGVGLRALVKCPNRTLWKLIHFLGRLQGNMKNRRHFQFMNANILFEINLNI